MHCNVFCRHCLTLTCGFRYDIFSIRDAVKLFWVSRMLMCLLGLQVGQVHGGLMGVIQRATVKACPHVWFERSEIKDRHLVTKR